MNESIKSSVVKGIGLYTAGTVKEEEVDNAAFLLVVKGYYKEHGYLPKEWEEYMKQQINKGKDNE